MQSSRRPYIGWMDGWMDGWMRRFAPGGEITHRKVDQKDAIDRSLRHAYYIETTPGVYDTKGVKQTQVERVSGGRRLDLCCGSWA